MQEHAILITAGIIFSFVAFMHLLRLVFRTEVRIGGKIIPLWVSMLGFMVPFSLSVWIFMVLG